MTKEVDNKKIKRNIKTYKFYKMFAYDWLFFYAISILYLTVTKKFSMSQILYIESAFTLFSVAFDLVSGVIVDKLGLKRSIIIGNLFIVLYSIGYIFFDGMILFIVANAFGALGFALKGVAEGSLLYSSLKIINEEKSFSKIEGDAKSRYFYLDAATAIISGILFSINEYMPMALCAICTMISLVISCSFYNVSDKNTSENITGKKRKDIIKGIFKSKRTRALLMFASVFYGILYLTNTLYKAVAMDIGLNSQYISIIVCIVTLSTGIGTKMFYNFEKTTKNRTLTIFSILVVISIAVIGAVGYLQKINALHIIIFLMASIVYGAILGGYRVAMKKYVLSFTSDNMRNQLTSMYYLIEYIGTTIITFVSGIILEYTTNACMCIILAIFSGLILIFILIYMKGKIGLKPQEYTREDINNIEV